MPKIYEYLGFVFLFYSNEHLPIHVHVRKQERESKCELIYETQGLTLVWRKIKNKESLTVSEKKEAELFIQKYNLEIVNKWNDVFVFNKKITCEKINKL